jgi:hypothetical protein
VTRARARAFAVLVALAAAGAGCPSAQREKEPLMDAIREYAEAVRWSRTDLASARLPLDARRGFVARAEKAGDDLEFADYEITSAEATAPDWATVHVTFHWTSKKDFLLKKTTVEQRWQRQGERWMRIEERQLGGDPHPLLGAPAR